MRFCFMRFWQNVASALFLCAYLASIGVLNSSLPAYSEPVFGCREYYAVRSLHKIKKGQQILESNLEVRLVADSKCSSRPIHQLEYVIERVADKQFSPGHIFTYKDFGLPEKDWPSGNNVFVYALHDIKKGNIIRSSDISQGKWSSQKCLQGGFSDLNLIINRPAKLEIQKGQILILPDVGLGFDYAQRMDQKNRKHKP